MVNFLLRTILIVFCLLCFSTIFAQKSSRYIPDNERFSAGLIIGYNSSQLDGDYQIGFDKFGIVGGIRGIARFTPRLDLNIEMLYSKKGSKIFPNNGINLVNPKKSRIIDLTYVDAPIYFKWLLENKPSIWHIELGGVYSRLIKTKITEEIRNPAREFVYESAATDFDKDDILLLAGFGYTWKKGFAINLRYVFGLKRFYFNEAYEEQPIGSLIGKNVQFLRNYHYNITFSYTIFQREFRD